MSAAPSQPHSSATVSLALARCARLFLLVARSVKRKQAITDHHATLPFKCGHWSALLQKPSRLLSIPFSAAHRSVTCPATVFLVHASRCPPRIPYLCYYLYFSSLSIYFLQSQSTSWGLNGLNPIQVPGPLLPMLYCSTRPTMTPSGTFQPPGRGVSRLPFG